MSTNDDRPQRSDSRQTRRNLLEAAGRIVRRDGVTRLTLDAVASEAGVSKGGVLYHFRTKEALIAAFVDGVAEAFDEDLTAALAADDGPERGRMLRAYVRTGLMPDPVPDLTAGLIAAVAWDVSLNDSLRASFADWHERAIAGLSDPVLGRVICLAADGFWISEWFGFGINTPEERSAVIVRLLALADLAANPSGSPSSSMQTD